jgi:hypothetical protein
MPATIPLSLHLFCLSLLTLSVLSLITLSNTLAAQVTLTWDGVRDPNIAGYTVYYGCASGSYEGVVDAGMQTTTTLVDLEEGQIYYVAVAFYYSDGEESELSSEIIFDGPGEELGGNTAEDGSADADEADDIDSDVEMIGEGSRVADAVETDFLPTLGEDSKGDQENNDAEAESGPKVIPQSQLSIVSVSSEPLIGDDAAEAAIDGQPETFWRTGMGAKAPVHPHELVIALGGDHVVGGFRYLPRWDGRTEGMVGRYSFYVSEDGVNWGKAVPRASVQ